MSRNKRTGRYLFIFPSHKPNAEPVAIYDTAERRWIKNPFRLGERNPILSDLSYYCGDVHGYLFKVSKMESIRFDRNREGEIILDQRPPKLSQDEIVKLLNAKAKKLVVSQQRQNLSKGGLTDANRYKPKIIYTDDVLSQAVSMKSEGLTWDVIAKALGDHINPESLKAAIRKKRKY